MYHDIQPGATPMTPQPSTPTQVHPSLYGASDEQLLTETDRLYDLFRSLDNQYTAEIRKGRIGIGYRPDEAAQVWANLCETKEVLLIHLAEIQRRQNL